MNPSSPPSLRQSFSPVTSPDLTAQRAALQEIDQSCRWPVLLFFVCGVLWLLLGTVFALITSWKMHDPGFLASYGWLSFGRVRPVHLNLVVSRKAVKIWYLGTSLSDAEQAVGWYKMRFWIEEMFRYLKSRLGLTRAHLKDEERLARSLYFLDSTEKSGNYYHKASIDKEA